MAAPGIRAFRVELADTDATGGIHHTAALRWAEQTEQQLLGAIGVSNEIAYPRRRIEVEFERPLHYGDRFEVSLQVEAIGRTSVTYRWLGSRGDIVYFRGRTVAVHVEGGKPAVVPEQFRPLLAPPPEPAKGA